MRFASLALALLFLGAVAARGAEEMPPKPAGYFNDYAGVVSREAALRFNEQLAQFERESSNQVLVAVFRKMQSDSSIADYTQRIAQSWRVGQAEKENGAVLFVFIDDRKMFIQVGYGLEGTLPDATAFEITERHIKPLFREGNYEAGLGRGIELMLQAIRGEYTGSGQTFAEGGKKKGGKWSLLIPLLFFALFLFVTSRGKRARGRRGWGYSGMGGPFIGGWGGGSSGGGWSGGSSGGGFSGFGGGGGSFGGGGGGSSW